MRWSSAISTREDLRDAITEVADAIGAGHAGQEEPDLVLVFVGSSHEASYELVPELVRRRFDKAVILGCSGGGILASGQELEGGGGLSMMAAVLPDVALVPFHLDQQTIDELGTDPESWHERLDLLPEQQPSFVLLPEPFSVDTAALAHYLDLAFPGAPKVGGLASGANRPGDHALFLEDGVHNDGAVGVALYGDVRMDPVVAQGCRPVGELLTITKARRNLVYELDGLPAVRMLEAVLRSLSDGDRDRFRRTPMVGLVTDPKRGSSRPGDFLVRNLVSLNQAQGTVGVGAIVEQGQQIRFHVRDAAASTEDLRDHLEQYQRGLKGAVDQPAGALVFSCLGRGEGLYGTPNHDSQLIGDTLGSLPMAGFFCNGEIGPVHGRTFLHGYTSALAIVRGRAWS